MQTTGSCEKKYAFITRMVITVKPVEDDRPRDLQNVVSVTRWSLLPGGLFYQVVSVTRWSPHAGSFDCKKHPLVLASVIF